MYSLQKKDVFLRYGNLEIAIAAILLAVCTEFGTISVITFSALFVLVLLMVCLC